MLQNAYFLAKIGADTAENEQHFAGILPIGRRVRDLVEAFGAWALARRRSLLEKLHHESKKQVPWLRSELKNQLNND